MVKTKFNKTTRALLKKEKIFCRDQRGEISNHELTGTN